jgi:hypothetical protein
MMRAVSRWTLTMVQVEIASQRHCAAPLAVTSMTLSNPNPTSATLPATSPRHRDHGLEHVVAEPK